MSPNLHYITTATSILIVALACTSPTSQLADPPALPDAPILPTLPDLCTEQAITPVVWPMEHKKFSLSIYHFNLQYVAGGLDNFLGASASHEAAQ